jgi:cation diffusion facilitator CzcD-associated flavoprotein CzcO
VPIAAQRPGRSRNDGPGETLDVVIVGAGFGGIGAAVALQRHGVDDFVVLEREEDLGGTWWANTYPGCQCDVPSHLYSFSFAPNPDWSRTYPTQPELLDYLRQTASRTGVDKKIEFRTPVTAARWVGDAWELQTPKGAYRAKALICANGPLSEPKLPDIDLQAFTGTSFHSAAWDHTADLAGKRIAVVGTGASAIQFVPQIAQAAKHVTIFQRTAPWVLPHRDRPIRDWERALYRRFPLAQRLARGLVYVSREALVPAFAKRPARMRAVARMGRKHIAAAIKDPALQRRLTPDYTPGCKRLLLSNDWYPTLARANVTVTSGVSRVTPTAVIDTEGNSHDVDVIIFATGFHVTDNPFMQLVSANGQSLAEAWQSGGMAAHKGTTVSGFPNMFLLAGPNTGIGHTSLVYMIESQIPYVMQGIDWIRRGYTMDVRRRAQGEFNVGVQRRMGRSVWQTGSCASWYQDSQGRNPTIWPDFTWRFRLQTRHLDTGAYDFRPLQQQALAVHERPMESVLGTPDAAPEDDDPTKSAAVEGDADLRVRL